LSLAKADQQEAERLRSDCSRSCGPICLTRIPDRPKHALPCNGRNG